MPKRRAAFPTVVCSPSEANMAADHHRLRTREGRRSKCWPRTGPFGRHSRFSGAGRWPLDHLVLIGRQFKDNRGQQTKSKGRIPIGFRDGAHLKQNIPGGSGRRRFTTPGLGQADGRMQDRARMSLTEARAIDRLIVCQRGDHSNCR